MAACVRSLVATCANRFYSNIRLSPACGFIQTH
jgi:hypothetical protein